MRKDKFVRAEMPWQPMCQQHHAPECQENGNSAQPRYRTSMNMTIQAGSGGPSTSDGIITDPARKCRRCEKRDAKHKELHHFSSLLGQFRKSTAYQPQAHP